MVNMKLLWCLSSPKRRRQNIWERFMNTRHVTSLVAAGAAIVMLLSGCGSTGISNSSNASDSNIISVYGSEPAHPLFPGAVTEAGGGKVVDQLFAGLVTYDTKGGIHNEVAGASPPATMPRITSSRLRRDGSSPTARRSPLIHSLMPGTTPPTVPTSRVAPASSAPFRVMTICRSRMLTRAQRSPV